MTAQEFVQQFLKTLPEGPGLFNPWVTDCHTSVTNSVQVKIKRLEQHVSVKAKFILVGEAPGYQGCRHSGVAFTSERLLLEGRIPRIEKISERLTNKKTPYSEPSATIVWNTMYQLGIERDTILWNALQMHPFKPGNPLSNRTPTDKELEAGRAGLLLLQAFQPQALIVAVGKKSQGLLENMGVTAPCVRHPANGGASLFRTQLSELIGKKATQ